MFDKMNLYTHDGIFHADDVFAAAMIALMCREIHVVRGGDTGIPDDPDHWIIFDIGEGELDHHSPASKEANGCHPNTDIPYASCGLVWRRYHQEILEAVDCPPAYIEQVFRRLDSSLVLGIDAADNGFLPLNDVLDHISYLNTEQREEICRQARVGFTVTDMIRDFNPTWNSNLVADDSFNDAVDFARDILLNRIDSIISSLDARDYISQCISYSTNHIMIMDQFAPWEGTLYSASRSDPKARDIWYAVYPALRGGWNVQCALLDQENSLIYRHPLPAAWYGLRGSELQKVSGIGSAMFCHVSGFLAGCETQTDALMMASKAAEANN